MNTSLAAPEGPGLVSGAPHLPAGFTGTFTSRYVDAGDLRLHAVTGGDGPPLLLVHGWPQTWYAWRMLMPALARDFSVVAVDQRGIGLSDKPQDGYDTGTLASDLVALMDALGHRRFALYGTDTGMPIAYALAADHPDRVDRLVVSDAPLPGISPSPPSVPREALVRPFTSTGEPMRRTLSTVAMLLLGGVLAPAAFAGTSGTSITLRALSDAGTSTGN